MKALLLALGLGLSTGFCQAAPIEPLPYKVPAKLPDTAEMLSPSAVRLLGLLGDRVSANEKNRLLRVDEEPLLAGFRHKPGAHPWIGEHVGKWTHAATLARRHSLSNCGMKTSTSSLRKPSI